MNLFDLAQQKVVFNPIGKYATDVTFAHIELRVPFQPYFDLAQELHKIQDHESQEYLQVAHDGTG